MSGQKRVTIDESEWVKLQKQAGQLRKIQSDLPSLIRDVRRQTAADLERVSSELENRQTKVEATVEKLSEQTRRLESDTNRRLREQAVGLEKRIQQSAGALRTEFGDQLVQQAFDLRSELDDVRRQGKAQLRRLTGDVDVLLRQADRSDEAARRWISDARAMHNVILQSMPHERHAPGQLASLERRLVTAEQDLAEGNSDPATAMAQEAYHGLSELRLDVELAERERLMTNAAAVDTLATVGALADENAFREVRNSHGQLIEGVTLDVDHWARGDLAALQRDIAYTMEQVRDSKHMMATPELRDVLEHVAPGFEERLGEIVERASIRQLSSQLRANVADVVVQTMDTLAGYEFIDGTYQGNDQREALFAKLAHQNGNEIVIEVGPSADDSGRFVLRVLSYDYDSASEAELTQRANALTAGLREQGLHAEAPRTDPGVPDQSLRSLARVRRIRVGDSAVEQTEARQVRS